MPVRLRDIDIAEIIERMKVLRKRRVPLMEACRRVADDMGITHTSVYEVVRRMRPTTEVATEYLRSQSLKLAMRVVRKANVEQAMSLLSRPNIGVLDPQGEGGGGGGRQFIVGVAMDSLGSVKVGVQIGGSNQPRQLHSGSVDEGNQEGAGPILDTTADVEPLGEGEDGEGANEASGEIEDLEPQPRPRRRWYRPDPKPKPESLEPAPIQEGRIIGQSLEMRLAIAKAARREAASRKRKEREAVSKRAKELKAQLAIARGEDIDSR